MPLFMNKLLIATLLLLIAAICAPAWFYRDLTVYAAKPAGTAAANIPVTVRPGDSLRQIADRLHRDGLITHPFKFRLYARLKKLDLKIKTGEYDLSAAMAPAEILARLVQGRVKLYRLTVPEGLTLQQIAPLVSQAGLGSPQRFLQAATDPALARRLDLPAAGPEGYLFPDTYFFPKGTPPEKIIATMIKRFREVFTQTWQDRAKALGFSVHQVVTLASIIEKETGAAPERPVIASVFHNRLKRGMRLESDPTVIYGIKNFDGNLTRRDLARKTPYNTYQIKGLPPGPIANPGAGALAAALFPADTAFIFFVAKKDGTHQFSKNLKDHNRAVRKYQLN